jgi:hypothetical protein
VGRGVRGGRYYVLDHGFLALPYRKFGHLIYRYAAPIRLAFEEKVD